MNPALIFIVPVRHQNSVRDWQALRAYMSKTLESISSQTSKSWKCIITANTGADLPKLPAQCEAIYVDLPLPTLPNRETDLEGYYDTFRGDKGMRVYSGLKYVPKDSHVMIVDFDDFISCRLASFVERNREQNGWNIDQGYLYSGGTWCYAKRNFHMMCGTSHIIRRDIYGNFDLENGQPDIVKIKRRLGSHISIDGDLGEEGHPLAPLPFPGAVYRIGNPQSTSGALGLFSHMTPLRGFASNPVRTAWRLTNYRPVTKDLQAEFRLAN